MSQRAYDNSRRRAAADQTRRRMVEAGCDVVRQSEVRDWAGLTMAAVAERAGVSERTVYRHLGSEAGLRDAVIAEIQQQAGIDLDSLRIGAVADVATLIFRQVASFRPVEPVELEPTLRNAAERQRQALTSATAEAAPDWSEHQHRSVAAVLDVLWSPAAYERIARDWGLDTDAAIEALRWAVHQVERAIVAGDPPVDDTTNS